MNGIKNLIFDLGGVILNIDFALTEQAFEKLGISAFSQYMTRFHITSFFKEYEVGRISDAEFIQELRALLPQSVSDQAIITAWNALLLDFPPERIELLQNLKKHYRLFLLSNTNSLHYQAFQQQLHAQTGFLMEDLFEKAYYSHTCHLRKPDAAIYELVVKENSLVPAETLFMDDTETNFSGAHEVGLQVIHIKPGQTIMELPFEKG
jgi:glucose-1-phosphatase